MNEKDLNRIVYKSNVDNVAYIEAEGGYTSQEQILADIARQLTIRNEIATRRHQIEYSLAFRINDKISYEVDSPVDISTPAPDANIRFEILAKAFFYDTKMMAPGKNQAATESSPGHSIEERQEAWRKWLEENDISKPAPDAPTDALVEAAKTVAFNVFSSDREGFFHIAKARIVNLQDALAAHEKAVT